MSLLNGSLTGPVAESLGWTLLHHLWQGALLAIIAACALRLMNRQSAESRYLLACAFLLLMSVFPVMTAFRVHRAPAAPRAEVRLAGVSAVTSIAAASLTPTSFRQKTSTAPVAAPWGHRARAIATPLLPWVVALWMAGVAFLTGRLVLGWTRVRGLCATGGLVPAEWQHLLERIATSLELHRAIRLLQSSRIDVPMVIGWIRPVVLVPASALTGLSARQLETIFAHELAHVRRNDYLVNLLQTLAETLFFYHPAVWWMSHRIRVERENCCDDLAVAVCGNPLVYARALATLEGLRGESHAVAANGGSLAERVMRLVSMSPARCSYRWVAGVSAFALVVVIAVAIPISLFAGKHEPAKKPVTKVQKRTESRASREADRQRAERPVEKPSPAPTPVEPKVEVEFTAEEISEEAAEAVTGTPATYEVTISGSEIELPLPVIGGGELLVTPRPGQRILPFALLSPNPPVTGQEGGERERWDGELTVDHLIALRNAGVDAQYIRKLRELGYGNLSFEDLLTLRKSGVSAEFIAEMNRVGLDELRAVDLVRLASAGITGQYVQELMKAGLDEPTVENFIKAREAGIEGKFLEALREAGFDHLTMKDVIRLHQNGVDAEFIRELKGYGKKKDVSDVRKSRCSGTTVRTS